MNNRYVRSVFRFPAAVLAAVLGVTIVLTAATWTVRPGGPVSAKSGTAVWADPATGAVITCTSSAASGRLKSGGGLPGTGIGSITSVTFTSCSGPGLDLSFTAAGLPWQLNFTSYNVARGVVTGTVSHVKVKVSGLGCDAVIDGTNATASDGVVKVTYTDSSAVLRTLTTGGNLHFYNVKGCAGAYQDGDPATLSGASTVSPKQTITSP